MDPRARRLLLGVDSELDVLAEVQLGVDSELDVLAEVQLGNATERLVEIRVNLR
jgi:hypothetical protein